MSGRRCNEASLGCLGKGWFGECWGSAPSPHGLRGHRASCSQGWVGVRVVEFFPCRIQHWSKARSDFMWNVAVELPALVPLDHLVFPASPGTQLSLPSLGC